MDSLLDKFGFRFGLAAFLATLLFLVAQLMQLLGLLSFPWDEILIYGFSLCIVFPFMLEMLALHYRVPLERKFWSHAALLFTIIYAVFVSANYVVQLATVLPARLRGKEESVGILVQTPHSLFWDFDAMGYISMGLAACFALPLFTNKGYERWVRTSLLCHFLVTPLIAVVYFYPDFSESLLLLAAPWGITAPCMMLSLAFWFKKNKTPLSRP